MGREGISTSAFYSVTLCVMINFSLRHNELRFSFVVVLYSMHSFYAIVKVVLLDERGCLMCNKNLRLKSPLRLTDHKSLLKHTNFDSALFLGGRG